MGNENCEEKEKKWKEHVTVRNFVYGLGIAALGWFGNTIVDNNNQIAVFTEVVSNMSESMSIIAKTMKERKEEVDEKFDVVDTKIDTNIKDINNDINNINKTLIRHDVEIEHLKNKVK